MYILWYVDIQYTYNMYIIYLYNTFFPEHHAGVCQVCHTRNSRESNAQACWGSDKFVEANPQTPQVCHSRVALCASCIGDNALPTLLYTYDICIHHILTLSMNKVNLTSLAFSLHPGESISVPVFHLLIRSFWFPFIFIYISLPSSPFISFSYVCTLPKIISGAMNIGVPFAVVPGGTWPPSEENFRMNPWWVFAYSWWTTDLLVASKWREAIKFCTFRKSHQNHARKTLFCTPSVDHSECSWCAGRFQSQWSSGSPATARFHGQTALEMLQLLL